MQLEPRLAGPAAGPARARCWHRAPRFAAQRYTGVRAAGPSGKGPGDRVHGLVNELTLLFVPRKMVILPVGFSGVRVNPHLRGSSAASGS